VDFLLNYDPELARFVFLSLLELQLHQCFILAALFTTAGFLQMKQWADGKHRNYKKEFPNYPKNRKPIVPFLC
jgi:very-long-chain enoyl-CoA reductase